MKGPSTRRFLGCLVNRPFTLGHHVGAVNPRQFRGFNRPALAAGIVRQGLSAVAARRLDLHYPSDLRRGCQPGRLSALAARRFRRQLKDGSIGIECQHP
tara:strand:- start:1836 stop:2132 length:297 start_codon:yes stop_codon:yes gene_type:complete